MKRLDKLLLKAEMQLLRRACKVPYDFSRLSTEVLKKIIAGKYTSEELENILAPVKIFDSSQEADAAYRAGFAGMAFIDDVEDDDDRSEEKES